MPFMEAYSHRKAGEEEEGKANHADKRLRWD